MQPVLFLHSVNSTNFDQFFQFLPISGREKWLKQNFRPQCDDMKCGKSKNEIKEAKAAGCMIHEGDNDYITADQGSITYPLNGNSYTNFEKCIWQIRPKTANKFLKVSIQLQSDSRSMQLILVLRNIWLSENFDPRWSGYFDVPKIQ